MKTIVISLLASALIQVSNGQTTASDSCTPLLTEINPEHQIQTMIDEINAMPLISDTLPERVEWKF